MAVTKAITKCVPFVNSNNKVDKWDITMKYENDSEGDATYYTSNLIHKLIKKITIQMVM